MYYVVNTTRYGSGKIEEADRAKLVFELACQSYDEVTLHRINPNDRDDFALLSYKRGGLLTHY